MLDATDLTRDRLDELFDINIEAGSIKWKAAPRNHRLLNGCDAGTTTRWGYVQIKIDGRFYRRARVIWFYATGEWPTVDVDHRNLIKTDDSIDNLREATFAQNMFNTPRYGNNTSGHKGIDWRPDRGWRVRIAADGKRASLGYYPSLAEAVAAREAALPRLHGEFARAA